MTEIVPTCEVEVFESVFKIVQSSKIEAFQSFCGSAKSLDRRFELLLRIFGNNSAL